MFCFVLSRFCLKSIIWTISLNEPSTARMTPGVDIKASGVEVTEAIQPRSSKKSSRILASNIIVQLLRVLAYLHCLHKLASLLVLPVAWFIPFYHLMGYLRIDDGDSASHKLPEPTVESLVFIASSLLERSRRSSPMAPSRCFLLISQSPARATHMRLG